MEKRTRRASVRPALRIVRHAKAVALRRQSRSFSCQNRTEDGRRTASGRCVAEKVIDSRNCFVALTIHLLRLSVTTVPGGKSKFKSVAATG